MNPAPLATTTGAAMVSGLYRSATASSVGLVTTTSAVGTAAIMRLRAMSRCARAHARTQERIALGFAMFFFDLLLGHAKAAFPFEALISIVDQPDHGRCAGHQ